MAALLFCVKMFSRRSRGVAPLVGKGFLFHTTRRRSFFIFSIDTMMFWPLQKLKKRHVQTSRIFFLEKKTFEACFWNGSTENLEMIFFGKPNRKSTLKFRGLWLSSLASKLSHVNPATPVHPISKTMFFGSSCSFCHKTGLAKTEHSESYVFGEMFKTNHLVNFWSSHFELMHPNVPFQG